MFSFCTGKSKRIILHQLAILTEHDAHARVDLSRSALTISCVCVVGGARRRRARIGRQPVRG